MADTSGVNLLTGKVNLSVPLGSITGPAGFGESVSLSYSTTGLLQQIKTWNQDAPTSTVGLGWSLEMPYIYRIGNGSLKDSFYLVSGGSVLPLLFCETINATSSTTYVKNDDLQNNNFGYSFVTQATSLLQIVYYPNSEYWLIRDGSGNEYRYGTSLSEKDLNGQTYTSENGCASRIRWTSVEKDYQDGQGLRDTSQPRIWTGPSVEFKGQEQYYDVWHIAHKINESNQRVNYFYDQFELGYIGREGKTKDYAICVYPVGIQVDGGGSAKLEYKDKESWEYPSLKLYDNQTNAFQIRRETKYLSSIKFSDANAILQNQINFGYDFLYNHFDSNNLPSKSSDPNDPLADIKAMNKRLLTYIDTLTNIDSSTGTGVRMSSPQEFDYWGLYDKSLQNQIGDESNNPRFNEGNEIGNKFKSLPTRAFSFFGMTDFGGSNLPAEAGRSYNALFGHLKTVKMPSGAIRWYSYSDNSIDSSILNPLDGKPSGQVKSDWKLKLDTGDQYLNKDDKIDYDSDFLVPPPLGIPMPGSKELDTNVDPWSGPKPYWGADGYVVIQWHTIDHRQSTKAVWICLQIYEWMGKWVPVTCRNNNFTSQGINLEDDDGFNHDRLMFKTGLDVSDLSQEEIDYFDPSLLAPYVPMSMGAGKFGLVRSNIEQTDEKGYNQLGNMTLFHRDMHMPGLWNSSYFSPTIPSPSSSSVSSTGTTLPATLLPTVNTLVLKKYNPDALTYAVNYYPQLVIGDNVAGLLDTFHGNLYLYSLSNNKWFFYQDKDVPDISVDVTSALKSSDFFVNKSNYSALTAYGDNILVLGTERDGNTPFFSKLCMYDFTQAFPDTPLETPWNIVDQAHGDIDLYENMEYENTVYFDYIGGIQFLSQDNFITAQIIFVGLDAGYNIQNISRPFVVSWDKDLPKPIIYIQKIYSPNGAYSLTNDSNLALFWGNILYDEKQKINGSVQSNANLINILTSDGGIRKYVARYVGGNEVGAHKSQYAPVSAGYVNAGWLCYSKLANDQTLNDFFAAFAGYDTTVAVISHGEAHDYTYLFYQFNPYYGLPGYTSLGPDTSDSAWLLQKKVVLGENFDPTPLFKILDGVFQLVGEISIVLGPIVGEIGEAASLFLRSVACGYDILDFVINQAGQFAYGAIESQVMSNIWRNIASDGGLGQNYLLSGTVEKTEGTPYPQLYYKSWDVASKQAVWKSADPYNLLSTLQKLSLPTTKDGDIAVDIERSITQDVYRYGQSFIPFAYKVFGNDTHGDLVRSFYEDQIACLRNGLLSALLPLPLFSDYYKHAFHPNDLTLLTPYYSIYTSPEDNFTLYTYWGGILCYQPQMIVSNSGTENTLEDVYTGAYEDKNNLVPASLKNSLGLKLCMYRDEKISGALSDFVVDKVSLDDGYQVYDTHILYKSDRAIYQKSMGSVTYNQVNIAAGGTSYSQAAQNNGWTEQYFYNGSSPYTLIKSETDPNLKVLPFDPATDNSNPEYKDNPGYTNADIRLNYLFGQSYCQRLMSRSGYEMVRQYSYYTAYNQTVRYLSSDTRPTTSIQYSTGMQELSTVPLQTNGNIMTLKLTLSAPDNTTQSYIQELVETDANGNTVPGYLITNTTMLYDLTGVRYLVNKMYKTGVETTYETGLLMSQQVLSNHYTYKNAASLTQPHFIPQSTIKETIYAFQIFAYNSTFTSADTWLWNPVIQTIISQTADTSQAADDMPIVNLPVSASATIWRSDTNTNTKTHKPYWYPQANYRWVGNSQEYLCTQSIPWQSPDSSSSSLKPIGTDNDWQLSSYIREITNGIINNTVNVTKTISNPDMPSDTEFRGSRTTIIYDKYKAFQIAKVISPNLVNDETSEISDEFTRFCSFEDYEDLSNWSILISPDNKELKSYDLQSKNAKYMLSKDAYYAGSQSLHLFYYTDSSSTSISTSSTPTIYWQALDSSVFTPSTLSSTPTQAILSFYTMIKRSDETVFDVEQLTISLAVAIIQPDMTERFVPVSDYISAIGFGLFYENNNWVYQQNVIDLYSPIEQAIERGDIAKNDSYRILIGFNFMDFFNGSGTFTSDLYIDTLSLVPYGSVASFKVYDQQTKLLAASLDLNGTTSRMIYDSRRRMIGSAIGQNDDQAVVSCPVMYYSRENEQTMQSGQIVDGFNNNDPNSSSLIQPAGGGQYFDFRINGDLMGWSASNIAKLSVAQGSLNVTSGNATLESIGICTTGAAIRAQVMPAGGYNINTNGSINFQNLLNTSMAIQNNNDKLYVTFNQSNNIYQFELQREQSNGITNLGDPIPIPNIPISWTPDDWLLALIGQSVYFFINGQLIIQVALDSSNPFVMGNLQALLGADDGITISFSNIMLMQDPRLSTQYTDGTGKIRQTQIVADLPSPPSSSAV